MMVLKEEPGLPTEEVQSRAVSLDERLSAKTVYNELNREKGRLYDIRLGRWFVVEDPPPESMTQEEDDADEFA